MKLQLWCLMLVALLLNACSDGADNGADATNPYAGYVSALYEGPENWLCRPGIEGEASACQGDLSATLVFADGSTQLEVSPVATSPAVDCFYVYPTVSTDASNNADLVIGPEEKLTTFTQFARYRSVCRTFAPVYRQATVAAIVSGNFSSQVVQDTAYGDVADAFRHYVANSEGRGFILVGHSQGARHLLRLLRVEIEGDNYLSSRMIAAHLIGSVIELPVDAETGADLLETPPCTFDNSIHCFVNYSSYRDIAPPEYGSAVFGLTGSADTRAACTNPVELGGGRLHLDAYFATSQMPPYADSAADAGIETPFVKLPGLFQGECIERDGKGYLSISVDADPADPRRDDVGADFLPGWGLHGIDIPLAHGDLVKLASAQAETWLQR